MVWSFLICEWQDNGGGGYYSDDQSQQDDALCDTSYVDEIVGNLMHEIQGLQYELSGMMMSSACEEPKPKVLLIPFSSYSMVAISSLCLKWASSH